MMLADRLRAALERDDGATTLPGDDYEGPPELVPASVLIAITDTAEPDVILTLRQATLRRHAGQIAFPGGRIDDEDESPRHAALREAWEEIGLDPAVVELVGELPPYITGSGYRIIPVVGVVPAGLVLTPHEAEVAAVFEVPLAFLLDSTNHAQDSRLFNGRERHFHVIEWQDRRIWGITAGLIVNLSRRLQGLIGA
jgi:8-oxo-dGTP pyrophosphatase MutT (NUDIX family)